MAGTCKEPTFSFLIVVSSKIIALAYGRVIAPWQTLVYLLVIVSSLNIS